MENKPASVLVVPLGKVLSEITSSWESQTDGRQLLIEIVIVRDVEAEAGSGHFLMEAEARKICRPRIIQKSIL